MKIYIAGKVTGLPAGEVFAKFNTVAYQLKRKGLDVVNPLDLCSTAWSWERCMHECLRNMLDCDAVFLLPDWQYSRGARLEKEVAEGVGMTIYTKIKDIKK